MTFDEALKISFIKKNNVLRSIADNTGHGTVALVSWCAVRGVDGINKKNVIEMIFCAVIACAIDLDHFISAKSFRLKDALSLQHRPPLHSTSILIPIFLLLTTISIYYPSTWTLHFLVTVSFVSHHVRDGHRRGLWFWPFGSTPPIPYWLYLVIITTLPAVITLIMRTAGLTKTRSFGVDTENVSTLGA